MYNNVRVLDVHGHVSVPFSANSFLVLMMGSNTPMASPIGQDKAGPAGVTQEDFRAAALGHAKYMDDRNIDVQIIGPRPFLMMGWMEPHLLPLDPVRQRHDPPAVPDGPRPVPRRGDAAAARPTRPTCPTAWTSSTGA